MDKAGFGADTDWPGEEKRYVIKKTLYMLAFPAISQVNHKESAMKSDSRKIKALTDDDAKALARQKAGNTVSFIALDCNWGPPISGRADTDYFEIWAAAKKEGKGSKAGKGDKVYVQGARNGVWDVDVEMKKIADLDNHTLYHLSMGVGSDAPEEFVIRLVREDGTTLYDNNGNKNYRVSRYIGHSVSAVATKEAIFDLGEIFPVRLYWPS